MKRLYLMVTIVTRHLGEKYLNFYLEHELEVQLVTLGRGTVNDAISAAQQPEAAQPEDEPEG